MKQNKLNLNILIDELSICKIEPENNTPNWLQSDSFSCIVRTKSELSIACSSHLVPEGTQCEPGWRAIKVVGQLDFALTGVLASIAGPLAEADISIFAISTFDTDYVLVKDADIDRAIEVLTISGHTFI